MDLLSQLAGWDNNDTDGPSTLFHFSLVHDVHQHGQHKGSRFA